MGGTGEALVAAASGSAARHDCALPWSGQVVTRAVGFHEDFGAGRDHDLKRLPVLAVAERSLSVTAAPRLEVGSDPQRLQIAQRVIAHEHYVAPAAAVAAVGTAPRNMGLTPEAQAAVTAPSGLDVNTRSILH